jgi:hypothetical protein
MGGVANLDDNVIHAPSGTLRGATLRLFDPKTRLWSIYWVDSREPNVIGPPAQGRFQDGVGTFFGKTDLNGKPVRVRLMWSDATSSSCLWRQAYSMDEGKTWDVNWIMRFTRVAA